jgi:Na+/proline symporter
MMSLLAGIAFASSGLIYLFISWRLHARASKLADQFPLTSASGQAHVLSSTEFSAATVATTLSLATVILAFAELAPSLGTWLLWPAITTAMGIVVVRLVAPIILKRMSEFGTHRPTLHEFLGHSYGSLTVMRSAAICTSLGFLGAFAVELTVGAGFLAKLLPGMPSWIAVILLAGIGATYTALGGFRAVVITDRIQMWAIWAAIVALAAAILWQFSDKGGWSIVMKDAPPSLYDFSRREGLGAFLLGIFVINVPTFISDMSVWQRIAASTAQDVVLKGLWKSALSALVSWSLFAILACALVVLVTAQEGTNPLYAFLVTLGHTNQPAVALLFTIVVAGLYAASLSTASTQLIAAAHTIHSDLLKQGSDRETLANASTELAISRWVLFGAAAISVFIVEVLSKAGFSIADLVFAVYGAQLGMVPAVLIALFGNKTTNLRLSKWAAVALLCGFAIGWASAALGTGIKNEDLVFLAPVASLFLSSLVLGLGWLVVRRHNRP